MTFRSLALSVSLGLVFLLITATTFSALGVALPAMIAEFSWKWTTAGLGFTALALLTGLFSPVAATSLERVGPRAHFLVGGATITAGYLTLGGADGVISYLIAASLLGAGFALLANVPGTYLVGRAVPRKWRNAAIGLYLSAGGAGGVFGPLIANAMIEDGVGWRGFWRLAGGAVAFAALLVAVLSPPREQARQKDALEPESSEVVSRNGWNARAAVKTPAFAIISSALAVAYFCGVTVSTWSVAHLQAAGLQSAAAVAMLSLYSGINAFSRAAGGVLARKIRARTLLLAALLANVIGMSALAFAHTLPLAIAFAIFDGFAFGMALFATTALLIDYFGLRNSPALLGAANLAATIAMIGPTIAGQTADQWGSFAPIFVIYAAGALLCAIAVALMRDPNSSRKEAATRETAAAE